MDCRRFLMALLLGAIFTGRCGSVPSCSEAGPAVQQRERQWLDAYEKRDAASMAGILGDGFSITYPDGKVQGRQEVIDYVAGQAAAGKAGPRFHTEESVARCYPGTVILTGLVVSERVVDGEAKRTVQRYTDTWAFNGKAWQVVASHLSDLP